MSPEVVEQNTSEQDQRFVYIPFARQQGPEKVHRIRLSIDFSTYTPSPQEALTANNFQLTSCDHFLVWGDTERLECIIPNTPTLERDGQQFIEDEVAFLIYQGTYDISQAMSNAVEFQDPDDLRNLSKLLSPKDFLKVEDFIKNRPIPAQLPDLNPSW